MLDRFLNTPVLDLVERMKSCRPPNISDADFRSTIDILRGVESCERLLSARYSQLLCSSAGPTVDCFIPAVAQMISEFHVKQNRPVRPVPDSVASSGVSLDDTLECDVELSNNDDVTPANPYSDISE